MLIFLSILPGSKLIYSTDRVNALELVIVKLWCLIWLVRLDASCSALVQGKGLIIGHSILFAAIVSLVRHLLHLL